MLVGHGRVGRAIAQALHERGLPFVTVERDREPAEALRERGWAVVWGDAVEAEVLVQAHVARAALLVVATPDTIDVRRMMEAARALNPAIGVLVRSHNDEEAQRLEQDGATQVFVGERTLAGAMVGRIIATFEETP